MAAMNEQIMSSMSGGGRSGASNGSTSRNLPASGGPRFDFASMASQIAANAPNIREEGVVDPEQEPDSIVGKYVRITNLEAQQQYNGLQGRVLKAPVDERTGRYTVEVEYQGERKKLNLRSGENGHGVSQQMSQEVSQILPLRHLLNRWGNQRRKRCRKRCRNRCRKRCRKTCRKYCPWSFSPLLTGGQATVLISPFKNGSGVQYHKAAAD